ncbi:MAG: type II toxin-antitoxin system RelE/ParE family toxin [Nostoc sp. EfeVER01]|uniref:type II toxin-antitoxin system RelE/ParE family toxin n=1 Tax=unclassified Nostoc TaxID=2593658 RepID=UPI002AD20E8E|nr:MULTISPECIES: type II toxin-antitoxin system RelE/ParE family toxin [unclassified Nostoc]MDZ7947778.1 type II toxin-antitoxin system RelE/ParE family toxin [Nostoc sp. EfeVER01]MDZ7993547.1 type II toxin-antitoxin system RelE/ParE family toxin [Nostoc sp. EspVER01]
MSEVRFTPPFKRRIKTLTKRYRQIQIDIQPIIDQLQAGNFIGDQISGINLTKVRAKNSDIPTGKSGGYRVIYQVVSPECVLLLLIYAKSDQADVSLEEIEDAIKKT